MKKTALIFALFFFAVSPFIHAQERYIQVQGKGSVEVYPDSMTYTLWVRAQDKDATLAKQKVDKSVNAILQLAKTYKIADTHIQADDFRRNPVYEWVNNQRKNQGEEISRSLRIELHDLTKQTEFLQALTAIALVQIQNNELGFANLNAAREQAFTQALQNAKQKAEKMAAVLNASVGKVLIIQDQSGATEPPIMPLRMSAAAKMEDAAPQLLQAQEIQEQVSVTFELQ